VIRWRLAGLAGGLAAVLALAAQPAQADTASDLATAQQRAAVISQVRSQLSSNLADALTAQAQLTQALQDNQQQQAAVQGKIDDASARLAKLDAELAQTDADITSTNRRIAVEKVQLRSLARALYVQPGSVLLMLAESHDLSDLISRVSDLGSAASRARALKGGLDRDMDHLQGMQDRESAARDEEASLRAGLRSNLAQLQKLQQQEEDSKAQLATKIAQTQYELAIVNSQSAQLAQEVTDLLQQEQDQIIAAAMQQVWDQVKLYEAQNQLGTITQSAGHSKQYRFMWPEPGSQISQAYGPTSLWFEPSYQGFAHFHTGIDMVLPQGSPVLAADDGVVVLVGSGTTGYGNYVVLEHSGGLTTLYGHLDRALVKVGDRVNQAQPIGLEGSTGNSTGAHLHFELRINNQPVDPTPYLPPGPPSAFRG
jgi:murein DD-endopeptidase MepM/ murein hydrolase activator NlpD